MFCHCPTRSCLAVFINQNQELCPLINQLSLSCSCLWNSIFIMSVRDKPTCPNCIRGLTNNVSTQIHVSYSLNFSDLPYLDTHTHTHTCTHTLSNSMSISILPTDNLCSVQLCFWLVLSCQILFISISCHVLWILSRYELFCHVKPMSYLIMSGSCPLYPVHVLVIYFTDFIQTMFQIIWANNCSYDI